MRRPASLLRHSRSRPMRPPKERGEQQALNQFGIRKRRHQGVTHKRVRSSGTSTAGCQADRAAAASQQVVRAGAHHEEKIGRSRQRRRHRLVAFARLVQGDVGLPAAGRANLERAETVAEVDDLEVVARLIGIGHDDQTVGPSDVEDAALPFVDGLNVIDAGARRTSTRPSAELACRSGSPRSPARWMVARVSAVTSSMPLNTRSSSVSGFAGSAADPPPQAPWRVPTPGGAASRHLSTACYRIFSNGCLPGSRRPRPSRALLRGAGRARPRRRRRGGRRGQPPAARRLPAR